MTPKPKVIAALERIAGDHLTPELRESIADETIQIVEQHYFEAGKALLENHALTTEEPSLKPREIEPGKQSGNLTK